LWLASSPLARKLPCKRILTPIIDDLAIGQSHFLLTNQQFIFIHTQWKLVYGIGTCSLLISHMLWLASSPLARKLPCKRILTPIIDDLAIGQSHFLLTNQQFIFIPTQWKLVYGIGTCSLLISHHALLTSTPLAWKYLVSAVCVLTSRSKYQ